MRSTKETSSLSLPRISRLVLCSARAHLLRAQEQLIDFDAVWDSVRCFLCLLGSHTLALCQMSALDINAQNALNGFAAEFTPTKATIISSQSTPSKLNNDSKSLSWSELSSASEEIAVAARYWARSMRQHDLAGCEVAAFENALKQGMLKRCTGHWYPNEPMRGSGHRSVINDFSTDPVILEAADSVRITDIGSRLPRA
eukprot:3020371-Rhodomonas_salina.1